MGGAGGGGRGGGAGGDGGGVGGGEVSSQNLQNLHNPASLCPSYRSVGFKLEFFIEIRR